MGQAAKFIAAALIGFLAWNFAGHLYLGYVYDKVTAKVQRGNDGQRELWRNPDFDPPLREIDTSGLRLNPNGWPSDDADRRSSPLRH